MFGCDLGLLVALLVVGLLIVLRRLFYSIWCYMLFLLVCEWCLLFCLFVSLVYALVVLLFGFDRWFGLVFRFGWLLYCLLLVFVFLVFGLIIVFV